MPSVVCTLLEGDFHLGLAALANSLVRAGFSGEIWAGYRGPRPAWAAGVLEGECHRQPLTPEVTLHWLPVATRAHLTNHKPEFLAEIFERHAPGATHLFYFDPDIVVRAPWRFFEEWADYGAALVEDVNSPLPESHPRRQAWRALLAGHGRAVVRETPFYVNGGFLGLSRAHLPFLTAWREAMRWIGSEIGGLENSMFSFYRGDRDRSSPAYPFNKTDQDALNLALMISSAPVSVMGSEGMDFRAGGWTMAHALGPRKPWRKHYLRTALAGFPPTPADREFWRHVESPLAVFPPATIRWRRATLAAASLLSRFYRRADL